MWRPSTLLTLLGLTLATTAGAADREGKTEAAEVESGTTTAIDVVGYREPAPEVDLSSVEELERFTPQEHRWFKPRRHLLPQNPYQSNDFTAYTLEFGEVKIGLAQVSVGIAPRVQLGTAPLLFAGGIYNGNLKANVLRAGPVDVALLGSGYYLPLGDFKGVLAGGGGMVSLRIAKPFSIHLGSQYRYLSMGGIPTRLPPLVAALSGNPDMQAFEDSTAAAFGGTLPDPHLQGHLVSVQLAADVRLNRRDSFVLQAGTVVWAKAQASGFEAGAVSLFGNDDVYSIENTFTPAESYTVSLAYQVSWKQLQIRVGGGASAIPFAWALQANDFSWRMGGATRISETRRKRAWRRDKRNEDGPMLAEADALIESEEPVQVSRSED